jgi:Flp pilus assembly protein TadB
MAMSFVIRLLLGLGLATGTLLVLAGMRGVVVMASGQASPRPSRRNVDDTKLVEALAVWTEQLRDTMAGARGLEQALTVTASTAPIAIRPAVQQLSAELGFTNLPSAVRNFAATVNHPLADFVAAALITASENQVRDMGSLLSHLAECCRDDVRMRTRVWVARARIRSAVRIIAVVIVCFVGGLIAFNPTYLAPYASPTGMVALAVVIAMFAASLVLLQRLGRFSAPPRFIARRSEGALS